MWRYAYPFITSGLQEVRLVSFSIPLKPPPPQRRDRHPAATSQRALVKLARSLVFEAAGRFACARPNGRVAGRINKGRCSKTGVTGSPLLLMRAS